MYICLKIFLRQSRSSLASWQSILWSQKKFLLIQTPLAQGSSPSGHSAKINQLRWIASKSGWGGQTRRSFRACSFRAVRSGNMHVCLIMIRSQLRLFLHSSPGHQAGSRRIPSYESAGKNCERLRCITRSPHPCSKKLDARGWPSAFDNYRSIMSPARGASSCNGRRAIKVRRNRWPNTSIVHIAVGRVPEETRRWRRDVACTHSF